ncbi:MAG: selenide, water dikinase SelD [Taibaiella sp.]|nr:selenide, water dikinase SelD [Taibaiella sp.]
MEQTTDIKLTQYSRGAGCGCKIAPAVLQEILQTNTQYPADPLLLIGNETSDDAAVYDIGNGMALIATTDFFMPIVDSAYDFGRIAAANAISDVYAMGGRPILANAILGWPVEQLPVALAREVMDGARAVCAEAGITLAGGHSIDTTEPIFGLAVNGICPKANLRQNNTAHEGDVLFLTKPLGVGILATAQKRGVMEPGHLAPFIAQLIQLNAIGEELGKMPGVTAMTDVTGFGIAGHLLEMAEGSGLSAELFYTALPITEGVKQYLAQRIIPDATYRNWNAYGKKIDFEAGVDVMEAFSLLPDPQTNGGLLIAVNPTSAAAVEALLSAAGLYSKVIGKMIAKGDKGIWVKGVRR